MPFLIWNLLEGYILSETAYAQRKQEVKALPQLIPLSVSVLLNITESGTHFFIPTPVLVFLNNHHPNKTGCENERNATLTDFYVCAPGNRNRQSASRLSHLYGVPFSAR